MTYIARLLETGLLLWLSLLVAIVIGRVLTGRIDVSGLLRHDEDDTGIAPERVVALLAIPVVLGSYVLNALHADMSVNTTLPDLSQNSLLLLTGGNGFYLAGKIARS